MTRLAPVQMVLALIVLALVATAPAQDTQPSADALEEEIGSLRLSASYADALAVARELVALRQQDPEAKPVEIEDAERLVGVLEGIVALPPESQKELASADSLAVAEELLWEQGAYAEAVAAAERHLEIRQRLLATPHMDIAASLNALAMGLHAQGDLGGAYPLYEQSLEMKREMFGENHLLVAEGLSNLGALLRTGGDLDGAEEAIRGAVAVFRAIQDEPDPDLATTLGILAMILKDRTEYGEAESLSREVVSMQRVLLGEEHPEFAAALNNLASVLEVVGRYGEAEDLHREALGVFRGALGDDHPQVAVSLSNLALALKAQGDYSEAEPLLRQSLATIRVILGDGHPYVARALTNLASLLRAQGDNVSAEPLFREALAVNKAVFGEQHPEVANSLNNLALMVHETGDYAGAEALHREALLMRRALQGDEHPEVAVSLGNTAVAVQAQGDFAAADSLFREALDVSRRLLGDEHPQTANSINNLAALEFVRGDVAAAADGYREAAAIWQRSVGDLHPNSLKSSWNLARCLTEQGSYEEAERILSSIAAAYDVVRVRVGHGLERATFLPAPGSHLAATRLEMGNEAGAWPAAERALSRSLADLLMVSESRDLSPTEVATEDSLKADLGRLERELAAYRRAASGDTTPEAAQLITSTGTALLAAESEWSTFQQTMAAKYPVTEGETFALERVQESLEDACAIVGWLDVSIERGEQEARYRESWCYAIRNSGPVVWERVGSARNEGYSRFPSDRVRSFRDRLASPESPDAVVAREAHELWTERIEPLGDALEGVEKLVVLPSGVMLGLPVETLVDGAGVPLGEVFAVSYAPSATLHTWLAEREGIMTDGGMLLVGDPPYNAAHQEAMLSEDDLLLASAEPPRVDAQRGREVLPGAEALRSIFAGNADALGSLPRLHGTRDEVTAVASVSESSILLLGSEASEQELVRMATSGELRGFSAIHIATHALVDDERPERSALVLSQVALPDQLEAAMAGRRIYDGLVTAKEIIREWDLNADLVTLSACETGLGREVIGEGYVGFAHAFLQAGARSLLVSLWKVEDEATSLLMRRFYENWRGERGSSRSGDERGGQTGEPMSKTEALQEAKHWLRNYEDERGARPYEHPYFWSSFVLIGDGT